METGPIEQSVNLQWPHAGAARIPYQVFSDPAIHTQEQERLFRGPTWNYVALEAELPDPGDFKATLPTGEI